MKEILIRRPRRWRTAAMTVLGIAAVAAYVAMANHRASQTARTIAAIERLNGMVIRKYSNDLKFPGVPQRFGPPDHVYFLGPKAGDRELEVLDGVPGLRILNLTNTRVTDEGIARLARFPKLNYLCIASIDLTKTAGPSGALNNTAPQWSGKGLAALKSLPELQSISLAGPHVTDADLPALMSLKRLLMIDLYQTSVTKEGVEAIRKALPSCQVTYR